MKKEFLEIVEGLWDSYEDDAFIRDKKSGVFYDPSKIHPINYTGNYFSVKGPLNVSRSRQGRPVIFQAGTSLEFMDIAAQHAEVIMAPGDQFEYLKRFTTELKRKVQNQGRSPNDLLIMPSHSPIVGETEKEALEKLREIESWIPKGYRVPKPQWMGSAEQVAEKIDIGIERALWISCS